MKRVQIDWIDSVSEGGWGDREEAIRRAALPDVLSCTSVGYLVADEDGYVLLATTYMRDGDLIQGALQIPKAAVVSTKELRL